VRHICIVFSGGKYVLRKHIRFVHSKHIIQHEVRDTMREIVEVADEVVNRTMVIAMFRHQRTPVVPLRTCHHVSPLCSTRTLVMSSSHSENIGGDGDNEGTAQVTSRQSQFTNTASLFFRLID
jgi:hypothetical protein